MERALHGKAVASVSHISFVPNVRILPVVQGIRTGGRESLVVLQVCAVLRRVLEVKEMESFELRNHLHRVVQAPPGASSGWPEGPFCHSIRQQKARQEPDQKNAQQESHPTGRGRRKFVRVGGDVEENV